MYNFQPKNWSKEKGETIGYQTRNKKKTAEGGEGEGGLVSNGNGMNNRAHFICRMSFE